MGKSSGRIFFEWIEGEGLVGEMWLWRGIKNMRYY